jgi:hypothetical protein
MTARYWGPPLAMRRHAVQARIAAQRTSIGTAWTTFEWAEARRELNLRRWIAWTHQASNVALFAAAFWTTRRALRTSGVRGIARLGRRAAVAVAVWRNLKGLLVRRNRRDGKSASSQVADLHWRR